MVVHPPPPSSLLKDPFFVSKNPVDQKNRAWHGIVLFLADVERTRSRRSHDTLTLLAFTSYKTLEVGESHMPKLVNLLVGLLSPGSERGTGEAWALWMGPSIDHYICSRPPLFSLSLVTSCQLPASQFVTVVWWCCCTRRFPIYSQLFFEQGFTSFSMLLSLRSCAPLVECVER